MLRPRRRGSAKIRRQCLLWDRYVLPVPELFSQDCDSLQAECLQACCDC